MRLTLRPGNDLHKIYVKHRVPGRKLRGKIKPGVPRDVSVEYERTYDTSRYPSAALRAIRARKTNFLGEVQR